MSARLEVESAWELDGSLFWNEQAAGRVTREQVRQRRGHGRGRFPQSEDAYPSDLIQTIFLPVDEKRIAFPLDESSYSRAWFDSLDGRTQDACDSLSVWMMPERVGEKCFGKNHGFSVA